MTEVIDWLLEGDRAIRWQTMRDLLGAPQREWASERSRVAHEGWGAHLLTLQGDDGLWDRSTFFPPGFTEELWKSEGQPWTSTYHVLTELWALGADPTDPRVATAVDRVASQALWDEGGQLFFDGETEPCINGRTVGLGAYFGHDVTRIVERLLSERLDDGGWNCEAPHQSRVSSFDTTINVLEGFAEYQRDTGGDTRVAEAMATGEEYLISRGIVRSLTTGEVPDALFTQLRYPQRWRHDVLRGLDHLRDAGRAYDSRCDGAVELLLSKRRDDGRWAIEHTLRGRHHLDYEKEGEPSRWITLRALRVLRWAEES